MATKFKVRISSPTEEGLIKCKKVRGKPAYSARWVERQGEKRNANLRWVNGFLSNNSLGRPMLTYSIPAGYN